MSATITTLINPNDKVVINVSGMRFETWYMTLNRFPNTLLGDPRKRCKYFDYIQNEYFFERHRQSFESILYFYQSNGRFLNRPHSVSSEVFFDEIVFFELGEEAIAKYKKTEGYIIDQEATLKDMPQNKVLRFFWVIFENPQSSLIARIIAVTSVICIIVSITVFCIETLPEIKQKRQNYLLNQMGNYTSTDLVTIAPEKDEIFYIETVCIIWFSIELIIRFICSPNKFQFIKHIGNIIDFFSILPYFMQVSETSVKFSILRIIRLVRVFRIFKLARHFKGLQILAHTLIASANELMLLVFFLVIGVVLFSSMVYFVELDHPNSDFDSIIHGFWYVIITMTTVGYGEVVPKTNLGRIVGSFCAIAGGKKFNSDSL